MSATAKSEIRFDQRMPEGREGMEFAFRCRHANGLTGISEFFDSIHTARRLARRAVDLSKFDGPDLEVIDVEIVTRPVHKWSIIEGGIISVGECLKQFDDHFFEGDWSKGESACVRCGERAGRVSVKGGTIG